MGTITKDVLIRSVAETTGQQIGVTKATIDAVLGAIRSRAEAGDTVKLPGFGSFQVKARPPRLGRNPKTGEAIDIPETHRLTFKASKSS